MRRNWIKVYVDQCLRGTMMTELNPAERYVWFGFLLLAGDNAQEGKISITREVGYTDEQIAALLKIPIDLLLSAKLKMIEFDKIKILPENIIEIVNWQKYQSEYARQRDYRKEYKERLQAKVTTQSDNVKLRIEGERERDIEREEDIRKIELSRDSSAQSCKKQPEPPIKLILDEQPKRWEGITKELKEFWAKTYPGCNVDIVLQEMIAYWDAQPKSKRKLNWKRTIVNRLKWIQDHGGSISTAFKSGEISEKTKKWLETPDD